MSSHDSGSPTRVSSERDPGKPPPPEASATATPAPAPRARPIGWGLVLIAAGVLWLLELSGVDVPWELVLPSAVIVIGLVVLFAGPGVDKSGLIALGVVLTILAVVLSAVPLPASESAIVGDHTYTVSDPADLEPSYALAAGSLVLDLRELELSEGVTEVSAHVAMGELVVRLPAGAGVEGRGRAALGDVSALGRSSEGFAPALELDEAGDGGGTLDLDLQVGLGEVEVTR